MIMGKRFEDSGLDGVVRERFTAKDGSAELAKVKSGERIGMV